MVAIVLVSHSRALAREAARVVRAVNSQHRIPVAYAGGAEGQFDQFGSDPFDIVAAVRAVSDHEGVVVLSDMGSTRMSADTAFDFLSEVERRDVRVLSAPLVEGAIAAAAQSAVGADLDTVAVEAERMALVGIRSDSVPPGGADSDESMPLDRAQDPGTGSPPTRQAVYRVLNRHGLHVRAAAKIIEAVGQSASSAHITNLTSARGPVQANSLSRLASIEVLRDHQILVSAQGSDAEEVVREIGRLVNSRFGELMETPPAWVRKRPDGLVPLSPGVGIGHPVVLPAVSLDLDPEETEHPSEERVKLRNAISEAAAAIRGRIAVCDAEDLDTEREIFEGHLMLLSDPELGARAEALISERGWSARYAFSTAASEVVANYRNQAEEYLQIGATDSKDVAGQVLAALGVSEIPLLTISNARRPLEGTVLASVELTASETFDAAHRGAVGFLTGLETAVSHAAVIARSMALPAVGGYREVLDESDTVLLDGTEGRVRINPSAETIREYEQRHREATGEAQAR